MKISQLYPSIDLETLPTETVRISALAAGESPRLGGESAEHIATLAQIDHKLPPIVVHQRSMTVIDGMHRLRAAALRGEETIEVSLFDGDDVAAFIVSVTANMLHGLPLSLADRTAAAERILRINPAWSDRAIAATVGLSAATVNGIRKRATAESDQLNARLGRDGKVRPINAVQGRLRASELLTAKPSASLREIAREAGVSAATVRDVRQRLGRGEDPVPASARGGGASGIGIGESGERRRRLKIVAAKDPATIVEKLRRDPSLRMNEPGRLLLNWLGSQLTAVTRWDQFLERVPPHTYEPIAQLARSCAQNWTAFADELERRSGSEAV